LGTFEWDGVTYRFDAVLVFNSPDAVIVLPDGRVVRVDRWREGWPPRPARVSAVPFAHARLES
jgi:hypothetical protein